jgi:hypothetical protein
MPTINFSKTNKPQLDFSEESSVIQLFGREMLKDKNKRVIISALLTKFLHFHEEIEESNGQKIHDKEFLRELKCVLKGIYFQLQHSIQIQYNGIAYYEINFSKNGKNNLLKINNPTIFFKE